MKQYAIFLRGINVGGHRKIRMKDLVELLEKNGFIEVQTYIQSGNLVLKTTTKNVEENISKLIHIHFGYDVPVIVRSKSEMTDLVDSNPFNDSNSTIEQRSISFFKTKVNTSMFPNLGYARFTENHVYIFRKDKNDDIKEVNTKNLERNLFTQVTNRNWKTTLKVLSMMS